MNKGDAIRATKGRQIEFDAISVVRSECYGMQTMYNGIQSLLVQMSKNS